MAKEILIFCDFCNRAKKVGDLKNLIQRGVFWGSRKSAKNQGWKLFLEITGKNRKYDDDYDLCPACIDEGREEDI